MHPVYTGAMRIILCLFTVASLAAGAIPVSTIKCSNRYMTEGTVHFKEPYSNVYRILTDYSNYNAWMINGLNGKDEVSRNFLLIFKDIDYTTNGHAFLLTYDINFIWPFGSTGNVLSLGIEESYTSNGMQKLRLAPRAPIPLVEDVVITLVMSTNRVRAGTDVGFGVTLVVAPILDFFFSMDLYKRNVEWRVLTIVGNLTGYITKQPDTLK